MAPRATVSISSKGQVALPKAMREELGWRPGDKLVVERQSKSIVLRLAEDFSLAEGVNHTRYEDVAGCLGPFHRTVSIEEMNVAGRRWRRKGLA